MRIFSTASATASATLGAKCMSAQSGMSYPRSSSPLRIAMHAFASFIPTTVTRTRSKPSSAHLITCSMVPSTSDVSVVAIVCRTSGCSEPNLIGPHSTVRVSRRFTSYRSVAYRSSGPYARSRGVFPGSPRADGDHCTASSTESLEESSTFSSMSASTPLRSISSSRRSSFLLVKPASDIMRTAGREAVPAETGTVGPAKRATEAPAAVIMRSICGKPLW
mmetsp:Transcript_3439/g.9980  ORF Transcript_3439/g.9980 Transcript_3439/m.9980 type:complete len:220 (+) Transcript_3439:1969-2628(+)